ncbi:hypothetical protein ACUNV4_22920 [Granulosicoccus sp. 3-233]|uniref:hypothetical protein n=1 Tax=Granulosicoccus sp. 3-233 TaxID=3417969 RepID=UPI003D3588E0
MDTSIVMQLHALTGSATVCSGAAALILRKGSRPHRTSGRIFTVSMLLMGLVVAASTWLLPGSVSATGLLFTAFMCYLVISAWSSVNHQANRLSVLDHAAPVVALSIAAAGFGLGLHTHSILADASQATQRQACIFFAILATLSMGLDLNNLRIGGVQDRHRIIRHVWRMHCALFFATSTLFTGPGSVLLPESLRGNPLLLIPQILVVCLALYWIFRLLFLRKTLAFLHSGSVSTPPTVHKCNSGQKEDMKTG